MLKIGQSEDTELSTYFCVCVTSKIFSLFMKNSNKMSEEYYLLYILYMIGPFLKLK